MSSDLVAFLRARLDEDEQLARRELDRRAAGGEGSGPTGNDFAERGGPGDPHRVLIEIDAKRRIVAAYDRALSGEQYGTDRVRALRYVARLLARSYAGHPEYRADLWQP